MKKLLLLLSLTVVTLSGCYSEPYRDRSTSFHRGDNDNERIQVKPGEREGVYGGNRD